jgi:hypothetical protein
VNPAGSRSDILVSFETPHHQGAGSGFFYDRASKGLAKDPAPLYLNETRMSQILENFDYFGNFPPFGYTLRFRFIS